MANTLAEYLLLAGLLAGMLLGLLAWLTAGLTAWLTSRCFAGLLSLNAV